MLEQTVNIHGWPSSLCLLIVWFFFPLLPHNVASQSEIPHIPLGSRLYVSENNSWVSPNGNFALGFFNVSDDGSNHYNLGIRFNSDSIPLEKRTLIWVAGADQAVGNESYFELNANGELVLFDSTKGVNVWTSKTRLSGVKSGSLKDDGNLILLTSTRNVAWQSFDYPSDTLVPGQNFTAFHVLRASSRGSVSSYYSLFMNSSGQLQLRWESSVDYWTSSGQAGSNLTARLDPSGSLQILGSNGSMVWSVFGEDHNDLEVRHRFLRLEADGNLRMYSWAPAGLTWRPVWQAVENQCEVFGTCGRRGVCVFSSETGLPGCKCPFRASNETVPSCLIPFPKRCESGFYMLTRKNMFLYAMYPPGNDYESRLSKRDCESLCLRDPLCTAATFSDDGSARCSVKKTQYVGGYADPSLRSVSFVKRCSDPMAVDPNSRFEDDPRSSPSVICVSCVIGAISGTTVIFVAVQVAVVLFVCRRRRSIAKKALMGRSGSTARNINTGPVALSFSEIREITQNFSQPIGASTFKGSLRKKPVAVKDAKSATVATEERKYRVAVSKIGSIHHKNLVRLEGYCCEPGHRFLVHEYAENGSVGERLVDPDPKLSWESRVEISVSVARAVCYLHTGCREFVSHGSLSLQSVVLDENLEAKVADFGLLNASAEKDVEDFGRLVLGLVTGLVEEEDLLEWAYKEWIDGSASMLVDKRVRDEAGPEELDRVMRIAFWCLQSDERMRPSMKEVVKVLEGTLSVDPPPPPFSRRRRSEADEDCDEDVDGDGSEPNVGRF